MERDLEFLSKRFIIKDRLNIVKLIHNACIELILKLF